MHRMSAVLGVEEMYLLGYQILTGLNYFFNIIDMVLLLYCLLSFFARGTRIYAMLDRLFETAASAVHADNDVHGAAWISV